MFEAADIREWRGHDVVDAQGHKIGQLEAIYVDTGTDLPSFGTVKVGMQPGTGWCSCRWTRRLWVRGTSGSATARSR